MLGEPCARCGALAVELTRYRIRDPFGDHVEFRGEYACGECGHRPPARAQPEEEPVFRCNPVEGFDERG
jgi:hypothetical protein